jgi:hypothetical protein
MHKSATPPCQQEVPTLKISGLLEIKFFLAHGIIDKEQLRILLEI